ncbi:IS66 family insertion sequence hypothetical protein [Photobacterium frigidiphilum]|uniref:Uncharacterized protein n=1 Tax=Photobacterium frigidiphilum TaxID=264736 RepID=A0A2T3JPB7_9GAMM|nr:hypothetical protein [Photobacterium frigidiphilum]PSU50901.1 IS66 family insertion sequence hypothetical protein [Photobacterium frigidiphilum]
MNQTEKRLKWPKPQKDNAIHIAKQQLNWLLSGLSLDNPRAHRPLYYLEV